MEQRGVLLRGIAKVLNAGGSALLDIYDTATSIKISPWTGEKGILNAQIREYEMKLERLYCEIGKEVALRANKAEDSAYLSAALEAGIKLAVEHQAEMEKIRQRIQKIEAEGKAAAATIKAAKQERAAAGVKTAPEPTPISLAETEEYASTDLPEALPAVEAAAATATNKVATEGAEMPAPEMAAAETADPIAGESSPGAEMKQETVPVDLEALLKKDLLQICSEKGIEADKRMTKAEIIKLISGHSQ